MAYDTARGVVVLFGGHTSLGGRNDETWDWNGLVWVQRSVPGPAARSSHAMAYDRGRGVTILFGGSTSSAQFNGDTWELEYPSCPADFNHDGFVNGDDYDSFAEPFESGGAAADINGDSFVNGDDFDYFAEHFEAGC